MNGRNVSEQRGTMFERSLTLRAQTRDPGFQDCGNRQDQASGETGVP